MSINVADFLLGTREERASEASKIYSEATLARYFCHSRMWKAAEDPFKGGEQLVDFIQGDDLGTAGYYNPVQKFNVGNRDVLKQITVYWGFLQCHYPLLDEVVLLNANDANKLVDYALNQEKAALVSSLNVQERGLFAKPNVATMETAALDDDQVRAPYSLLCFMTRDGLAPSSTNGGVADGTADWTTVHGVPTSNPWWRNQTATYNTTTPTSGTDGVVPMFDELVEDTEFELPDPIRTLGESPTRSAQAILTTRYGIPLYKQCLRAINDQMERVSDPAIKGPQYEGIVLKSISELENLGWTATRPDYLWVDLSVVKPFVNPLFNGSEVVAARTPEHINRTVVFKRWAHNRICRSRRRLGRGYAV